MAAIDSALARNALASEPGIHATPVGAGRTTMGLHATPCVLRSNDEDGADGDTALRCV